MIKMIKKNKFSILGAMIIMYLSLTSSHAFDKVSFITIPHIDKIVHFGMYFGLMSAIILENRKTLYKAGHLFLIGLIPFFYGVVLEIIQSTLTFTRTGSFYDALFNCAGILVSISGWLAIRPRRNKYSDSD
jgi:VanZ family protein